MDFLKQATGSGNDQTGQGQGQNQNQAAAPEAGGGFMDKVNNMAGGGAKGEKNEDVLDKTVDFIQEKFLGGGDQSNESATEQAKDEAISDFIRDKYKTTTGSDFPIQDKDKKFGA